jgi:hypothetical protein
MVRVLLAIMYLVAAAVHFGARPRFIGSSVAMGHDPGIGILAVGGTRRT